MPGILGDGTNFHSTPIGSAPVDRNDPVAAAVAEHCSRLAANAQRVELARMLTDILYDDFVAETERAYGTANTRACYKYDFQRFSEWAASEGLPALPTIPEAVAHYVISSAPELSPQRLARAVAAIRYHHEVSDLPYRDDLLIKAALRWVRRRHEEEREEDAGVPNGMESVPNGTADEPAGSNGAGPH